VPAIHVLPVPAVAGSAVWLSHLVRPVTVEPLTHVKLIHSSCCPSVRYNLHEVTVGTTARVAVVSEADRANARVVLNHDWYVLVATIWCVA